MRFIQLAALIVLTGGPLWAMQCERVRAADRTNDAVYDIKLGMSVGEAETVLAAKTKDLSDASLPPGALRIEHGFYDCSSLKTVFVMRALTKNASGYRAFGPQLAPPAGTCTDVDRVRLEHGHVYVTYLPMRPGDASSQVVARVELAEGILFSHALPSEHIPVHYYEHVAIEKYGEPTYRDAFRPHKTVKVGPSLKLPYGIDLYSRDALGAAAYCNKTKCTEHQGWLAWCPDGVSTTACSRPTGIPEDDSPGDEPPLHYEPTFIPHRIVDLGMTPGTAVYNQDIARQERANHDGEERARDSWMKVKYQLSAVSPGPARRLVEKFFTPVTGPLGEPLVPSVLVVMEDLALFRKSFPTKVTVPNPVVTPSF